MFNYTKRYASTIRFWWNETKSYNKIDEEIEKMEGFCAHHPMSGFYVYINTKKRKQDVKDY